MSRAIVLACLCACVLTSSTLEAQASRSPRRASRAPAAETPASAADSALRGQVIRAGSIVRPDTVAVGDPFSLIVTIEVPTDATVQWPTIGDTSAVVVMRAVTRVSSLVQGATRRETAEYSLAAWDVGVLPVGLPDATVRTTSGVRAVPLRDARIVVMTVLPADTSLHVPKPARALFPRVIPWWELWWPAAAAVAGLLLLWWIWRRRRHKVTTRVTPPLDAFVRAMHDFERLQRLALADLGERGRAVALAVEILRMYLSARLPAAARSETSVELMLAIGEDDRVPSDRLTSLLAEADAIKFAHRTVSAPRAQELQAEARALVETLEKACDARRKREDAERAAAERVGREASRTARRAEEEHARRRVRRPKAGAK